MKESNAEIKMRCLSFKFASLFVVCPFLVMADNARFQVQVVDERTGCPLQGIKIRGVFLERFTRWENAVVDHDFVGDTNGDGVYSASGKTNCGEAVFRVCENNGFYDTGYVRVPFDVQGAKPLPLLQWWRPDNQVITVSLQRVEHPTPLFVKNVRLANFENGLGGASWTNCTFRYDLLKGDWLPPLGKGETGDLEINSRFEETGRAKMFKPQEGKWGEVLFYTLHNTVSMASKDDRLEEVTFDPRSGIRVRKVEKEMSARSVCFRIGDRKTADPKDDEWCGERIDDCEGDAAYVFRIRTRYDEKGKIRSAYYGKVYGRFRFQGNETVGLKSIEFLYYLNPTSLDRNLEWDMKTNLCPGRRQSVQKRP